MPSFGRLVFLFSGEPTISYCSEPTPLARIAESRETGLAIQKRAYYPLPHSGLSRAFPPSSEPPIRGAFSEGGKCQGNLEPSHKILNPNPAYTGDTPRA